MVIASSASYAVISQAVKFNISNRWNGQNKVAPVHLCSVQVCMHQCICARVHAPVHLCKCACTCAPVQVCMHLCTCAMCACTSAHVQVCMHQCTLFSAESYPADCHCVIHCSVKLQRQASIWNKKQINEERVNYVCTILYWLAL